MGVPLAEPGSSVTLNVRRGLYDTHLGGPGMTALPASIEPAPGNFLFLRIWFDAGTGTFQALSPDLEIGAVAMALHARTVTAGGVDSTAIADGAITTAKIAAGAVNELGTPDGTVSGVLNVTNDETIGVGNDRPQAGLHVSNGVEVMAPETLATIVDDRDGFDDLDSAVGTATSGSLLAVASRNDNSVSLIDISDPMMPELKSVISDGIGGFDQLAGANSVAFHGNLLAVAARVDDSVTIIDTTDPLNPSLVNVLIDGTGGFDKLDGASEVAFKADGTLAVAAELDDTVTLVGDAGGSPTVLVTIEDGQFGFDDLDGARGIAFREHLMAVAATDDDAVSLIDISTPSAPSLVAVMKDEASPFTELAGAAAVAFNGALLAIGAADDGAITLVDTGPILTPTTTLTATIEDGSNGFDSLAGVRSLLFSGDLLIATALDDDAVTIVDTATPAIPIQAASFRDGFGAFNELDGARHACLSDLDPDVFIVAAMFDDSITLVDLGPTGTAGAVVDHWIGVGTSTPQAALHVQGGLIVDDPGGLVDMRAKQFELGVDTIATGVSTFATGRDPMATGDFATAMGRNNHAAGFYSLALGRGTVAPSGYEIALGRYNTDYEPIAAQGWNDQDRLFVIGNGNSLDDRSDLLTIDKGGHLIHHGEAEIDDDLSVGGAISGGGDITAGGAIDAGGDIEAGDDVVASGDFEYSGTKTGHLQIPGIAFKPDIIHYDTSNYFRNSNGSIRLANASTSMTFFAEVDLPDGATVTKVEFSYKDDSSDQDYTDIDLYLKRTPFGSETSTTLASITNLSTSGQSSTPVVVTDSSISSSAVDTFNYHYYLQADLDVTLSRTTLTFNGARITYTVSKVAH